MGELLIYLDHFVSPKLVAKRPTRMQLLATPFAECCVKIKRALNKQK